jgi:hypothetical protein
MLAKTFAERLESWSNLRQQVQTLPVPQALESINRWWFQTPWRAYHLHWDDQPTWPDPWQLLDDNIYCSLARALGIMYTIAMLERDDMQDAVLAEIGSDNLVLVSGKKYILNWDVDEIVNINLEATKMSHSVTLYQIQQKLR